LSICAHSVTYWRMLPHLLISTPRLRKKSLQKLFAVFFPVIHQDISFCLNAYIDVLPKETLAKTFLRMGFLTILLYANKASSWKQTVWALCVLVVP